MTPDQQAAAGPAGLAGDPSINLETISWLRAMSGLPVIGKACFELTMHAVVSTPER